MKESSTKKQVDSSAKRPKLKTIIKVWHQSKWMQEHPCLTPTVVDQTGTGNCVYPQERPPPPNVSTFAPGSALPIWGNTSVVLLHSRSHSKRESSQTTPQGTFSISYFFSGLELVLGSQGHGKAKPVGFIFSHTTQLIRIIFYIVLKQVNVRILIPCTT